MPLARQQIREAGEWWSTNRTLSPDDLAVGVRKALATLAESPRIGRPAPQTRRAGVRTYLVRLVRYHIYYRINADVIEILAFWHASRGSGPPI